MTTPLDPREAIAAACARMKARAEGQLRDFPQRHTPPPVPRNPNPPPRPHSEADKDDP